MEKLWMRASDMAAAPAVSRSVVVATGAGPDARHVRAVDVDRDRGRVAGVVHAVDVAGRREAADVAGPVLVAADQVQAGVEQLLVLDALDDAEDAPGDVVVDPGELAGPPDQGDDRERAVRLAVQVVGAVLVGRAEALLGGQDVGGGEVTAQLAGDELSGLGPVGMAVDGGADAGDEWAQPAGGADPGRGHAVQLPRRRPIRPMPTFVLTHR